MSAQPLFTAFPAQYIEAGTAQERSESDRANVERLLRELGRRPAVLVPYLDEDVHDIAGLVAMNEHLFAADAVAV